MKQKYIIFFMHITAFFILCYDKKNHSFDIEVIKIGFYGVLLLILGEYSLKKVFLNSCPLIWNGMFFLIVLSLFTLQRLNPYLAEKQIIWFFISIGFVLVIPFIFKIVPKSEKLEYIYLFCGILFLILPFFLGSKIFGSINWIQFGKISIQPSEIVKFIFVMYLSSIFRKSLNIKEIIMTIIVVLLHILILVLEKDLGGALIFFVTFMIIFYVSTGLELLFFLGIFLGIVSSYISYRIFDHVKIRIKIWQNPWDTMFSTGNQILQGLFAICNGGMYGTGLKRGYAGYIPVVTRDYIFAAICEEMGLIFAIGIIIIYIMIFYRGIYISLRVKRKYYSLIALGFTTMLAFQTFLIIGGVIKLIPLTGVTLPFVSYGGSSVFVSTMMIGILQWLFMRYSKDEKVK